jgi:exodeoxyribonuclease-3
LAPAHIKVASWNVNSVRKRLPELLAWVAEHQPDVLCLQEIKAIASQIPDPLHTLADYHNLWHGGPKGYSGVSLHVRKSLVDERPTFEHPAFDFEGRVAFCDVLGARFCSMYLPNGGKDFEAKMRFLKDFEQWSKACVASNTPLIVSGDLNVTRTDRDVHPAGVDHSVIGQRPDERAAFEAVLATGLVDGVRMLAPDDDRLFTWWAAWRNCKERNLGWRIDYVLTDPRIGFLSFKVFREVGTSDHAPILCELALG